MKNSRKTNAKKFLYTIGAIALALGLGIGAILLSMLNVQASTEMMPGIEQILDEKSSEAPFRILELVNKSSDAEIGYYISGQEPYLTQYTYTPTNSDGTKGDSQTFSSIEEGLSVLPTEEQRKEFVEASDSEKVKNPLSFSWNEDNAGIASKDNYPLSFKSYAEKYFLLKTDESEKWNRVDFKESRKETLKGHYEENSTDKGDYTKEEQQYYPIREDVRSDGSTTQKYRENMKNFFYSDDTEASAPYQLSFEKVSNEDVNQALNDEKDTTISDAYDYSKGGFGYYENVYSELTSDIAKNIEEKKYTFPGENPTVADSSSDSTDASDSTDESAGTEDAQSETDITDTDDLTGGEDDGTAVQNDVGTAGTQANPYIYRGENIEEHPYYKYKKVGDLEYIKDKVKKSEGISERKDGDITLEDGQYWYWTAESTDNGDDSESATDNSEETGTDTTEQEDGSEEASTQAQDNTEDTSVQSEDDSESASTQTSEPEEVDTEQTEADSDTEAADDASSPQSGDETVTTDTAAVATQAATDNKAETVLKKEALYLVTGRQAVSQNQVKEIPADFTYAYYYKVSSVEYCCKLSENGQESNPEDYTYYGWYYASHPSNEDTYIKVDSETDNTDDTDSTENVNGLSSVLQFDATHYISEAQYTLTPGKGNYDFVEGTGANDTKQSVELDHLFYQGGYTNHDWFKRYVFHLDPDNEDTTIKEQFKNLSIKVDTKVINANGTETDTSELPALKDYDLIYINGTITSAQAIKIAAETNLPAIINQKTAMSTDPDKTVIDKAFAAYVDEDYLNTSYVSQRIYFTNGDLCNLEFHTDFTEDDMAEFSEITDYINSENNYREVIESGESGEKTEPLSSNISQARVIEYIINYKYKRQTAYKKTVNVLDIEPAKAGASISESDVKKWLGLNGNTNTESPEEKKRGTIKNFCCQERKNNGAADAGEGSNGGIDKILDGDKNTYWHSAYSSGADGTKEKPHWFEYKLSSQDRSRTLTGIRFIAKVGHSGGGLNGRPYKLQFEVHKINGTVVTETATFSDTKEEIQQWSQTGFLKEYTFKTPIKKVDYIRVTFVETYSNPAGESTGNYKSTEFATCAEFSTLYQTNSASQDDVTVNITSMTSSEFVGHIDDINTEYDAIYFGDSYSNWDFRRNGDVTVGINENSQGKKVSLYSHSGGVFGGVYDRSYNENGSWLTGIQHNRWVASRLMGLLDIDYAKDSSGQFIRDVSSNLKLLRSPNNTPGEIGEKIGRMRGSGNDITKQQLKELKDFVSSGYPVIIGDKLLNADGTAVNTDVVDSSSYMYEFLNDAMDREKDRVNVMSKAEADQKQNLNFFFYMAKPQIKFTEIPPEPERLNDSEYKYNQEAELKSLPQSEDGLTFKFTIKNDSEISTANATYNCELFIDLNFDGNLSSNEEQSEYMQIQDDKENVVKKENNKYHLKIGKEYTLTRKIPKDYYKVITWKIQVSNNDNSSIRTSRMGFTKREAKDQQPINVLQIYPGTNMKNKDGAVTWYLDKKRDPDFNAMLAKVGDFKIDIEACDTREYEDKFKNATEDERKHLLDQYQMIIIGFADGFGIDNIDNTNKAVDAIRDFIEDGKSVLFSHDTTSFVNTNEEVLRPSAVGSNNTPSLYNPDAWPTLDPMPAAWNWGYSLNTFLRAKVGMDRYGITSDEAIKIKSSSSAKDDTSAEYISSTVSKELKKGNDLEEGDGTNIYKAIKEKVSDMAYVFGNKKKSSLMTQGFSNNVLDNNNHYAYNVSKVNEGAITQYPNYIADLVPTSRTHSQYYQLAMEEDSDNDGANDIVVWYCLSGEGGGAWAYQSSPNDVRNNYYFYSKGNVIYTGVGDSGKADANTGEITEQEKELFVNAIIAAANVTAVEPEATFLDDFDPVSNQEDYRYYMPDRLKASEVSGTSNILDGNNTFNVRIRDYNMVASNLDASSSNSSSLTMELYIDDPDGKETIEVNGRSKTVSKISVEGKAGLLKKYSDGQTIKASADGQFKLPGNDTFQFSLKDMESYLKKEDGTYKKCNIYAKVASELTIYGKPYNKVTWATISLKPRQLFDLD